MTWFNRRYNEPSTHSCSLIKFLHYVLMTQFPESLTSIPQHRIHLCRRLFNHAKHVNAQAHSAGCKKKSTYRLFSEYIYTNNAYTQRRPAHVLSAVSSSNGNAVYRQKCRSRLVLALSLLTTYLVGLGWQDGF